MKKGNIMCFLIGALLFGSVGVFAGQYVAQINPYSIKLNGKNVSMEGYNIDGSTYFKLRDISSVVGGFDVNFNNDTIQLSKDGYVYNNNTESLIYPMYETPASYAPDFGAIFNAELISEDSVDSYYYAFGVDCINRGYATNQNDISEYENILLNSGFEKVHSEVKEQGYILSLYKKDGNYIELTTNYYIQAGKLGLGITILPINNTDYTALIDNDVLNKMVQEYFQTHK